MPEIIIAKIYRKGQEQSVRIPPQFHFKGNRLHIRNLRGAVLLEPIFSGFDHWATTLDRFKTPFMSGDRNQPTAPDRPLFL
jgi:virulence-associated protein VagC